MTDPLPFTPRGLSRDLAALYLGIPPTMFDELVRAGSVPQPKVISDVVVWDRHELDIAFDCLTVARPTRSEIDEPDRGEPIAGRPKVFTPKTLAKFWGCSERHVYKLCTSKHLGHFKLGAKLIRIRPVDVEVYEREHPKQTAVDEVSTEPRPRRPPAPRLDQPR